MGRIYKTVSCAKKGNICKHYFHKAHRDRKTAYAKFSKRKQNAVLDNEINAKYGININAEGIDEADRNAYRRKHKQAKAARLRYRRSKLTNEDRAIERLKVIKLHELNEATRNAFRQEYRAARQNLQGVAIPGRARLRRAVPSG